jgi:hypothetical protein
MPVAPRVYQSDPMIIATHAIAASRSADNNDDPAHLLRGVLDLPPDLLTEQSCLGCFGKQVAAATYAL